MEKEIIIILSKLRFQDIVRTKGIISFGTRFQKYIEDSYIIYIIIYTDGYNGKDASMIKC